MVRNKSIRNYIYQHNSINQFGDHTLIFKGNPFTWLFSKLHLKKGGRINNKVPLYSTGNYIQYPIINHNGKEYVYICIHMYMSDGIILLNSRN